MRHVTAESKGAEDQATYSCEGVEDQLELTAEIVQGVEDPVDTYPSVTSPSCGWDDVHLCTRLLPEQLQCLPVFASQPGQQARRAVNVELHSRRSLLARLRLKILSRPRGTQA